MKCASHSCCCCVATISLHPVTASCELWQFLFLLLTNIPQDRCFYCDLFLSTLFWTEYRCLPLISWSQCCCHSWLILFQTLHMSDSVISIYPLFSILPFVACWPSLSTMSTMSLWAGTCMNATSASLPVNALPLFHTQVLVHQHFASCGLFLPLQSH